MSVTLTLTDVDPGTTQLYAFGTVTLSEPTQPVVTPSTGRSSPSRLPGAGRPSIPA